MADLPLAGLRVIELGQLLAGPFCAQILGDFGAEVIKIEQPGAGDPMRAWGRGDAQSQSLWWPIIARNKRSITCNLRVPAGQELLLELAAQADVIVENFRPGTLERWNLGPDRLKAVNPGLILTRVTGYGQSGPYSGRAGYGSIGEAMGGIRYTTGDPSLPPSRTGISIGDSLAGTFAAIGTLVSLINRGKTGTGQVVDSAIYEAVLALMESTVAEWEVSGIQRERTGSVLPNVAPSNVYPTKDGSSILIAANQDSVFARLTAAMDRPGLASDERYASHSARGEHMDELDATIAAWTATYDSDALLQLLHESGVPAGRIYRPRDMVDDPHFLARESLTRLPHPELGEIPMANVVPRLSETPGKVRSLGPALGADNVDVYTSLLNLTDERVAELIKEGVI